MVVPSLAGIAGFGALLYFMRGSRLAQAGLIGSGAMLLSSLLVRELLFTHALMIGVYSLCGLALLGLGWFLWERRYVLRYIKAGRNICDLNPRLRKIANKLKATATSKTPSL